MFPFDRHERLRRDLSAYADGELSPRDAVRLEAHLEDCEACRTVLDGLRMASDALGGLRATLAPRSFALTPEMAGDASAAPAARSTPAYANGLRFAAAGLAVALAVVMVADRSNFGGEGDSGESQVQGVDARQSQTLAAGEERSTDYDTAAGGQPNAAAGAAQATSVPALPAENALDDVQIQASAAPELAFGDTDDNNNTDTESPGDDSVDAASETKAETEGIDEMTVVEVVLAALLVATLAVLTVVWVARRRHSA